MATESYIKEALTNIFGLVSSNGTGYVRTAEYKKRVEREEAKVAAGELARLGGGELPVEAEERRKRRLLCMEDLRLALDIGEGYLGQVPILAGSIANSRFLDTPGMDTLYPSKSNMIAPGKSVTNGIGVNGVGKNSNAFNGLSIDPGDPMVIDEELAWQGGSVKDIDDLDGALDAVLELGDL